MTDLLNRALARIAQLPPDEQDALASLILDEIADEERWAAVFQQSEAALSSLADEALVELREGRTLPLDSAPD